MYILENEVPQVVKNIIQTSNVKLQLVPLFSHRKNAAERTISTWKDYIIAGLSTTDNEWHIYLWCKLLPQCDIIFSLIRISGKNPLLSVYQQFYRNFDFNTTTLVPLGILAINFESAIKHASFSNHGVEGWYTDSALEYYRCYKIYKNHKIWMDITIDFFPSRYEKILLDTTLWLVYII